MKEFLNTCISDESLKEGLKLKMARKWLTRRRQKVIVYGEISNWKSVLSGLSQRSVLGPILFLIYV